MPGFPSLVNNPSPSKLQVTVLVSPLVIFFFALLHTRTLYSWQDPSSVFFDETRAYERRYSTRRLAEAAEFVARYNGSGVSEFKRHASTEQPPYMCVGMTTIVRPSGDIYARDTVSSMLASLSQHERDQLYVVPMIGHIHPAEHPMYSEPWLARVCDRVLTYASSETLPSETLDRIMFLEAERDRTGMPDREKHLIDYVHLMRVCAATGASYVTMLEDDVLFMDGWFHRVQEALAALEQRAGRGGWFYLRLFYTEAYFGWQTEEWGRYICYISFFAFVTYILYRFGARRLHQTRREYSVLLLRPIMVEKAANDGPVGFIASLSILACTVMLAYTLTVLYIFLAGRLTIFPQPKGVLYMPNYGCCSQGLVFPNEKVAPLAAWYEKNRIGYRDTLAERLADEKPDGFDIGGRWGVNPALLQHVGGQSSKGDGWEAAKLWNFAFEKYDGDQLRQEHDATIKSQAQSYK